MRHASIVAAMTAMLAAASAGGEVQMGEPMRLGFAGASLALPVGYDIVAGSNVYTAIQAARREQDQDVMLVKLSAWPAGKTVDLAKFVQTHNAQLNKDLSIRALKVIKEMPLKVAGLDAVAQIQTYTSRGVKTMALRLFVLRPIGGDETGRQLGYELAVEADWAHRAEAMPVLRAIMATMKLFDPVAPVDEPVEALGPPIESRLWGYSIRPPALWKAAQGRAGTNVTLFQMNYTHGPGPEPMPRGQLVVGRSELDAEACGVGSLHRLEQELRQKQEVYAILRQGKAKMAGLDGYGFIVRSFATELGKDRRPAILVQRTVCLHGMRYTLVLIYRSENDKIAADALAKIAAGMKVFRPAELTPKTAPATTTAPAPTAAPG